MSIQNKPDYKIFASGAKSGEIETFPDILRGWGVTIDRTGEIPPMEWFNGIGKRVDEWLMYLTQRGLAQWDVSIDYPVAALVQYGADYYVAIKNNKGDDPITNSNSWSSLKKWMGVDGKLNTSDVSQSTGTSTTKVMSQKAVTDSLENKINTSSIVQTTGQNTYSLMSQKSVSDALDLKVNYTAIVQSTGQNQYSIMSQKAVTGIVIGVGQTWKDVSSSRGSGVEYTNSSSKPIFVIVTQVTGSDSGMSVTVDDIEIANPTSSGGSRNIVSFMVPSLARYKVTLSGNKTFVWSELK